MACLLEYVIKEIKRRLANTDLLISSISSAFDCSRRRFGLITAVSKWKRHLISPFCRDTKSNPYQLICDSFTRHWQSQNLSSPCPARWFGLSWQQDLSLLFGNIAQWWDEFSNLSWPEVACFPQIFGEDEIPDSVFATDSDSVCCGRSCIHSFRKIYLWTRKKGTLKWKTYSYLWTAL